MESEHSMITRSKGKLLELEEIKPFDDDELDDKGNIQGLIDYECNSEFDNDIFQKELKRLRGGRKHNSPTKKKIKKDNKLSEVFLSYMLMQLFNPNKKSRKLLKKNRKKDTITMKINEEYEKEENYSESSDDDIDSLINSDGEDIYEEDEDEDEEEDEEYDEETVTDEDELEYIEMDKYDEEYIEMEDDTLEEEDPDFSYFQNQSEDLKEKHLRELNEIKNLRNTDVPLKFKVLNSEMDIKTKSIAIGNIEKLSEMDVSTGEYCKMDKWINGLINIPFGKVNELPINNENSIEEKRNYLIKTQKQLDNAIYGHKDAKMHILQVIGKWIKNPQSHGNVLAIQGPMGNGKTTLVKEGIAKAINRPFAFIALGGASDSSFFDGHSYTYEGSHWGRVVDILIDSKCMNPIIYFDELDKISDTHKGDEIVHLLTHLTDPSQNSLFQDNYFPGIHLDLSKALFIFSFNDETKIDRILKDRMYVINTKGFKPTDKVLITRNYLLPELFETFLFTNEELIFSDESILYIIDKYTGKEEGVRNLKRCLETIISKINIYYLSNQKDENDEKDEISMTFKIKDFKLPLNITPVIIEELIPKIKVDNPPEHMYM